MQFDDIIRKYRSESLSKHGVGSKFEELMARYFMTDPTYAQQLEWTKTWMNFPYRKDFGGSDTGIDLVAKTVTGEYWAIQCKCYDEDHRVTKSDMDTFLATSGRRFRDETGEERSFSYRVVVATTDNWGLNATEVTLGQTIPVTMIGLRVLNEAAVKWEEIEEGVHGPSARSEKHRLRPHQEEALRNAVEHYSRNDRGKMIMACGTGKTFTSLRIAEALVREGRTSDKCGCVLVLAPSIALVGQTLREWMSNAEEVLNPICVCSDPTVSRRRSEDDIGETVEDLGMPATTDAGRIAFQHMTGNGTTVVFSTYQSIDSVIAAQRSGLPEFDLVVCDEAHRTTGVIIDGEDESNFTKVHSNDNIRAKKRLYMTATPRLYGVKGKEDAKKASVVLCSMDDESIYGDEFYSISFGKAVELNLLSDYKVLILTTAASDVPEIVKRHWTDGGKEIDVDTDCKIWGCLNALAKNVAYDSTLTAVDPGAMRSAVSFCRTISVSKKLTERFNEIGQGPTSPLKVKMAHIDGGMNAMMRDRLLTWLEKDSGECHILSNVRCLSEGVDVPALDAVMFMDAKGSLVDVVQSVGRVMRKAEGKQYGYIIIPIVVPEEEDPEDALDDNDRYKVVWQVLRALRSHDERLDAEINTFQYKKSKSSGHIQIGHPYGGDNGDIDTPLLGGQYTMDDFGGALLARLVLKVGDRDYIENWARDVAKVMPALMDRLTQICSHEERGYRQYKPAFNRYLKGLRSCVNDNVSEQDAINMLAQQIVTKPIFEKLFGGDGFVMHNPVSKTIDEMLGEIDAKKGLKDIDGQLQGFYGKVETTLSQVETADGKQEVITALYEKFFKNAFPKDQAINGVVYTPIEIVDFITRSASDVLKQEFGIDINDENVNILDPFTGTGTFIARMIESDIITKENLERKYRNELFANEITLLAYYIATVNIENAYARATGSESYVPFENILLTDTFNIEEICRRGSAADQRTITGEEYFVRNKKLIRKENGTPITLILGNPPYGANQKSANDDAKKRKYETGVDKKINETYLDESLFYDRKGNVNSVYDNYIRAFRWSTDRIGDRDGAIAFVTPNGWLTGSAFEGFRKTVEKEFSKIFIFDLRGDQNSGSWRQEGEKIFGQGSKVGIAITLLVKRRDYRGKARIHYFKTPDYAKRTDKSNLLKDLRSFVEMAKKKKLETIEPKPNGDWLVERNEVFNTLIPLAGDTSKKFDKHNENTIFVGYSRGYGTSSDAWSYNYSKEKVLYNMQRLFNEYNDQVANGEQNFDPLKISWTTRLKAQYNNKKKIVFKPEKIVKAVYRPFVGRFLYSDEEISNDGVFQITKFFPKPDSENLLICVSGIGVKKDFSCLMTDCMTDLNIVVASQCFPLYWYEDRSDIRTKNKQSPLFGEAAPHICHDGVSDYALKNARSRYGPGITKEDIFYYVYGYLHSPEYRKAFSEDLKLSLPKIDFVDSSEDFKRFVQAGRDLADLHLNYEDVEAPRTVKLSGDLSIEDAIGNPDICRVNKMKLIPEERKLIYNQYITVENIPEEAFEYMVNGRSALGWIVDQYQYSVDKYSRIVSDPNEYAGSTYILKLVLSVMGVSAKTAEIVERLPKLDFETGDPESA
ncbi:MAG: DEAD/DEAH box helicase [Gammaproteobacteria bacterium]|nr:DEAD/DEAH box helicase [Gammaproteobacteria bacterium]